MRECVLFERRGRRFRKKREAVILEQGVSRGGCSGSAVFVCNSLLRSQSPSVPLLQCSSFMHPPGWQSTLLIG